MQLDGPRHLSAERASPDQPVTMTLTITNRGLLLKRLRRAGIQTLDWDVTQPFDLAVRHLLSRLPHHTQIAGSVSV